MINTGISIKNESNPHPPDPNQTLKGIVSRDLKEYMKIYDEKWGF